MRPALSKERAARLREVPLFSAMPVEELERIEEIADEIEVAPGELLVQEGAATEDSFVVISGEASVAIHGDAVTTLGPGGFFGEMAALELGPRSATITATTAMRLLVIGRDRFQDFIRLPGIARRMLHGLSGRLRDAEHRNATDTAI